MFSSTIDSTLEPRDVAAIGGERQSCPALRVHVPDGAHCHMAPNFFRDLLDVRLAIRALTVIRRSPRYRDRGRTGFNTFLADEWFDHALA